MQSGKILDEGNLNGFGGDGFNRWFQKEENFCEQSFGLICCNNLNQTNQTK